MSSRLATRLERIDPSDAVWSDFVANHPDALPFHHPAWARVLAESYRFSSFAFRLVNGRGEVVAGLPALETRGLAGGRRWISLPFTDYCPPLVVGDGALYARLETELDDARREAGVHSVEMRAAPVSDRALTRAAGFRHTLQLDKDPDTTFKRFRPSVRNKIRGAQRNAVTTHRAEHESDLVGTFYDLHASTRRRLGVPVQPLRYFSLLWRHILEPGLGFLLIARAEGRPVAAGVFLAWRDTVVYKYGASNAAAWRLRPNNSVLWHAIAWACENGYSTFDFGRTESANAGLREFKRGWGTEETSLDYAVMGAAPASGSTSERAARLVAPVIRRAPLFVCRGIGRALYRYAA